ncbi:beta-class phenol-soluble modulin [Corynebacterium heidelbergense]|uniref:Uncharacterized protein n=1 Tax=Corynebacterium heidelbergense TaxID=2055947 RepID=A0A364V7T4_9CORY|nr:beta-class phenol-soluble modulin [Corynebacterium heidelbergense]RAV32699.1 hypothetical protein CWC39_10275 [Corynebacterium heidelbergense]WCZ36502.1 hypothetical protein CHEID_04795 [Corynebacterium heidelbergense]
MIDALVNLGGSIVDIVKSAIEGDWGALAKAILGTVGNTVELGSSAIDGSSAGGDAAAAAGE